MILTNARILTFDETNGVLDSGSVEILPDGAIGFVRSGPSPDAGAVDLHGRLLMPALINGHTHLYSTLARGMRVPGPPPPAFRSILKNLWWRLDRALNEEDVYYSALIGLIESARCGVGTVIDHHSSPTACAGSLDCIERAFLEVGLRGATCYETSDRNGRRGSRQGIRENIRFLERVGPGALVGGMFGLHAAFTLGDTTLAACVEANQSLDAGFHVHVAEDRCDHTAVRRLSAAGALTPKTLAAHCIHITAADRRTLARHGVNVIHNPQSNCNNAVGTANVPAMLRSGVRVGLGSDGYSPRMWDEFRTATHLQNLHAAAAALANNRDIVRQIWGTDTGRIAPGARADLLLIDYLPPTPLDSSNLPGHLLFGISNAPVDSLMVNGRWVLREGRCVNLDERAIAERAAMRAKALWDRL